MAGGRSLPVYSTGTVAVASVSGTWTVTGSGTNFIAPDGVANYTALGGDMFVIPNVGFATVNNVVSATSLTLDNWSGGTVSAGTAYKIYRFEGLSSSAVVALINQLLTYLTDANPPAALTVDTGAVRFKFDDDGSGDLRLRIRSSSLTDASYVTALLINDATGALTISGPSAIAVSGGSVDGSPIGGTTPAAGTFNALRSLNTYGLELGASTSYSTWNAYYSSGWKYRATDYAYQWLHNGSALQLNAAPSGTANAAITFATAISIAGATGAVSFPSGVTPPADWGTNRAINGGFDVWQSGTSITVTTGASTYTADQWLVVNGTSVSVVAARSTSGLSSTNGINLTATGVAAAATFGIAEKFEASALQDLAGSAVTISFDVWGTTSAGSLQVSAQVKTNTAIDNGTFSTSAYSSSSTTISNTPTRYSFTVAAGSTTNLKLGAEVFLTLTQLTSTGNVNVTISGVKIEKGQIGTPFASKPITQEFADCEQFLQTSYDNLIAPGTASVTSGFAVYTGGSAGNFATIQCPLRGRMRAAPTVTLYSPNSGASAKLYNTTGSADVAAAVVGTASAEAFSASANNVSVAANSQISVHWKADARL